LGGVLAARLSVNNIVKDYRHRVVAEPQQLMRKCAEGASLSFEWVTQIG
jgi:hypothetical protein